MKYYKLIDDPQRVWTSFEIGKIYPETIVVKGKMLAQWLYPHNTAGHLMQEVTEEEYRLQEGILPEKWYIVPKNKEEDEVLCKWRGGYHISSYSDSALSSEKYWNLISSVEGSHTRITFEQFKKYVLKEEIMSKKIVGYKLIKPEMYKAASLILYDNICGSGPLNTFINVENHFSSIEKLTKASVLDVWFEPIYFEEIPVVINGYPAVFHENSVSFECKDFTTEFISKLVELTKNNISIHDKDGKDLKEELTKIYIHLKNNL